VATPGRLVELQCPACGSAHWVIDNDYRGAQLVGQRELSYPQRTYTCSSCGVTSSGHHVLQKSPPEFFLQPHELYPMSREDFDHWLGVLKEHFPDYPLLREAYRRWYPNPGRSGSPPGGSEVG
jgi:hypothetical protein